MKREIEFRGKRVDGKGWVYGYYVYRPDGKHLIYWKPFDEASQNTYHEVIPETVGQFTELTDKNGTKIFEGDIVKWDDESKGKYWRIAEVKINPSLSFDCSGINEFNGIKNSSSHEFEYGNFYYRKTEKHLEIVGNIHDKPINP